MTDHNMERLVATSDSNDTAFTITTQTGSLAAVHGEPAGVARATVVLIPGSGPIDRDGNAKQLKVDIQRQLSVALVGAGFATVRWDKRGVGRSAGSFLATGFHDGVADALVAVDWALALGRPVVVIGHSEGSAIAARLAAERPELAAIVLLSGYARSGREVLRWQAESLGGHLPLPVRAILRLMRTDLRRQAEKSHQKILATTSDVARVGGVKLNAKWFREFIEYDPLADLAGSAQPVLALTGSFDLQTPPEDLQAIAAARTAPTETVLVEGLSHILRRQDTPSVRAYKKDVRRPIDPEVIDLIVAWVTRTVG